MIEGEKKIYKNLGQEASEIQSRLLDKKNYFDIPPELLPEDIRILVDQKRTGGVLNKNESEKLKSWVSENLGEREHIELGKYPEEIRELVRKMKKEGQKPGQQRQLQQILVKFLDKGAADKKDVIEADEEIEEVFKHRALNTIELNKNFSNYESLAVVGDFYKEILKKDSWDKGSLDSLKGYLIDKHPDSVEEIQVIAGLVLHLYLQEEVEEEKEEGTYKYDPERSRSFAEYNYLFSHFFANLPPDRVYGHSVFSAMSLISAKLGLYNLFRGIWQGNLGQVAIYKALAHIGQRPEFSTPKEDVYYKIDLWAAKAEKEAASFQIKTTKQRKQTIVLKESEWLDFPSVSQGLKNSERHFISEEFAKVNRYSAKVKEYGRQAGKDISAYYVVIPSDSIDYFTGELAPGAVKKLQEKIRSLGGKT